MDNQSKIKKKNAPPSHTVGGHSESSLMVGSSGTSGARGGAAAWSSKAANICRIRFWASNDGSPLRYCSRLPSTASDRAGGVIATGVEATGPDTGAELPDPAGHERPSGIGTELAAPEQGAVWVFSTAVAKGTDPEGSPQGTVSAFSKAVPKPLCSGVPERRRGPQAAGPGAPALRPGPGSDDDGARRTPRAQAVKGTASRSDVDATGFR